MTPKREVRLALAGCGVVGSGLVRLLHDARDEIASRFDVRFSLASVLVRDINRQRQVPISESLFTSDLDAFLKTDADVVVEAIGGDEPARTIAASAIAHGRKFVTANKELIAGSGDRLSRLADERGTSLDFGAAVGASAPVISTLRDLLGASPPRAVRGILNGTSNFVITQIERGADFTVALNAARQLGLAEEDCSKDLDGRDAAAKLAITAWVAFGIPPATLRARRTSLLPHLPELIRVANGLGGRLRFIAECAQLDANAVVASVEPTIVNAASGFARTVGEENRIEIDQGWSAPLTVSGPGAGGAPTAAALLSDLLRTTPPANARGSLARAFYPVADRRDHRWLLLAPESRQLEALLATHGVSIERSWRENNRTGVVTGRAKWEILESIIGEKRLDIAVARVELPEAEVRVQ